MPGVLKDLRSAESIRRASAQPGGDFEAIAGNVVRRRTGADLTLQNDGKQYGTPDLLLEYPDGRRAIAEVTTLRDQAYTQTLAELTTNGAYPPRVERPELMRVWTVTISGTASVKDIWTKAPPMLHSLDEAGLELSDLREYSELLSTAHPVIMKLSQLGVVEAYSQAFPPASPER